MSIFKVRMHPLYKGRGDPSLYNDPTAGFYTSCLEAYQLIGPGVGSYTPIARFLSESKPREATI